MKRHSLRPNAYFLPLLAAFLLFFSISVSAQRLSFGLRAGSCIGTFNPKSASYKGDWEKSQSISVDGIVRLQLSHHVYGQLGVGYYQRHHEGAAQQSTFQGGVKLRGHQPILNIPFLVGYYTANPLSKWYGFAAGGFVLSLALDKKFEEASWNNVAADIQLKDAESGLSAELGAGYFLRKNVQLELGLRFNASQFTTAYRSNGADVYNTWYFYAWNPGLSVIYRTY